MENYVNSQKEIAFALKELKNIFANPTEADLALAAAIRAEFDDKDFWSKF